MPRQPDAEGGGGVVGRPGSHLAGWLAASEGEEKKECGLCFLDTWLAGAKKRYLKTPVC